MLIKILEEIYRYYSFINKKIMEYILNGCWVSGVFLMVKVRIYKIRFSYYVCYFNVLSVFVFFRMVFEC